MTWMDGLKEKDRVRSGDEIKGRDYIMIILIKTLIFLCQLRPNVQQHTSIVLSLDDKRKKTPVFFIPRACRVIPRACLPTIYCYIVCVLVFSSSVQFVIKTLNIVARRSGVISSSFLGFQNISVISNIKRSTWFATGISRNDG